jgi:hypothetical protein
MDSVPPVDRQVLQGRRVLALRRALAGYDGGVVAVSRRLRAVLQTGAWQHFQPHEQTTTVQHGDFAAFVHATPPHGLGSDLQLLLKLCAADVTTLDLLDRLTIRSRGNRLRQDTSGDDEGRKRVWQPPASQGNSRQYALRRLRASYPELHRQVLAGELSVHHAMVGAGLRCHTISLPIDGARAAAIILRHFPPEQLIGLAEALSQACGRYCLPGAPCGSQHDCDRFSRP